MRREPPGSTCRLQLHAGFGFADVAAVGGYLADLGVTHVYLSPILQAAPGSPHGYDVTDHSAVSADLGGEAGFRDMAARLREHGLGVVVDVVPNHMGIGPPESLNRQFWSVLARGPDSPCAHWFDIDWAARGGRLLLPVLAGPPEECAADLVVDPAGEPRQPGSGPVLRYYDHVLPLVPGTAGLPLPELLAAQHYELAGWRTAAASLNWRRFFDISTMIGIQVQEADVFAATHEVLLGLAAEGLIDGLRVDHPDGLADPRGYLRQLATVTSGAWVVAEKILAAGERLPADWACAGTTGYDSLAMIDGLLTSPAGAAPLTAGYTAFTGGPPEFGPVAAAAKRQTCAGALAAEISRLARLAARTADPVLGDCRLAGDDLRHAIAGLASGMGVYRAYVVPGEPPPAAALDQVAEAARQACARLPARLHRAVNALAALVLDPFRGAAAGLDPAARAARAELAVRFQQTCGPVMAKSVEDTAFYRWSRLVSRNEVGSDPGRLAVSPAEFHDFAARLAADWPATMTTLSTHDTKRGEDVRARLAVLAERPAQWAAAVARWHDGAKKLAGGAGPGDAGGAGSGGDDPAATGVRGAGLRGAGPAGAAPGGARLPAPDTEYLMWQTLAGAWPVGAGRLTAYLRKAMREAKSRTSWTSPDASYEDGVLALARRVVADPELSRDLAAFAAANEADARANALGAKLAQLTMPGVPDLYQGCELGFFALVDPDNREPADFGRRAAMLAALDEAGPEAGGPVAGGPVVGGPVAGGPVVGGPVVGGPVAGRTAGGRTVVPAGPLVPAGAGSPAGAIPPALAAADAEATLLDWQKLLVTSRALRLRRDHPDWFAGRYEPLAADGPAAEHAVAFARAGVAVTVITRLPGGLRDRGGWAGTTLALPGPAGPVRGDGSPAPPADRPPRWRDVLTGAVHESPAPLLADLTAQLPVALLVAA